jgi:hypothetical protein
MGKKSILTYLQINFRTIYFAEKLHMLFEIYLIRVNKKNRIQQFSNFIYWCKKKGIFAVQNQNHFVMIKLRV